MCSKVYYVIKQKLFQVSSIAQESICLDFQYSTSPTKLAAWGTYQHRAFNGFNERRVNLHLCFAQQHCKFPEEIILWTVWKMIGVPIEADGYCFEGLTEGWCGRKWASQWAPVLLSWKGQLPWPNSITGNSIWLYTCIYIPTYWWMDRDSFHRHNIRLKNT